MFYMAHTAVMAVLLAATGDPKVAAEKQADDLIQKGNDLRRRGDNYGAVEFFRQAFEIAPNPKTEAQLGLAEQATGRFADAEGHLTDALRDTQNPWIKKNRPVLKDSLEDAHAHVGRIEVLGDPVGAVVLVNGKPAGTLPLAAPVPVNAGSVDIEVSADGFATERRSLTAPAQQVQTAVFRLRKVDLVARNPEPSTAATANPNVIATAAAPNDEVATGKSKAWIWFGVSAVVAAAVLGGILLATRKDEYPTAGAEVSW